MTVFRSSVNVGTGGAAALACAIERFERWGFTLSNQSSTHARLQGPGMRSNREARARGASLVTLTWSGSTLALDAELGAADKMARFCKVFPVALGVGLGFVLGTVYWFVFSWKIALVGLGAGTAFAIPWLALGPWMATTVYGDTREGLQAVLQAAWEASER